MSFKAKLVCVSALALVTACGGGGGDSSTSDLPAIDVTPPVISISSSSLTVPAGGSLDFQVTATDSGGFGATAILCDQGTVADTTTTSATSQIVSVQFGAPATAGPVSCFVTSSDFSGNSSNLDFTIDVTPVVVQTSSFNGEWFGPCFNNGFGFSVRQSLTINGTNLDSFIESFTAGATPAPNCVLPADGQLITTDVGATLAFGPDLNVAGCTNGVAIDTDVNIQTVDTSGNPTATTEPAISDTLNLVTGFVDLLPNSTSVCSLTNGNLLFAGVEYTGAANSAVISPMIDLASDVTWALGDIDYAAGTSSSTQSTDTNIGVVVVSSAVDDTNGDFAGSTISVNHTLNGSGVYQVTTAEGLALADATDSTVQLVDISVTVGTGVGTNTTRYDSIENSGFVVAVVDEDGAYHFSTQTGVTLDRTIDVDGGIPNAPDQFSLEMNNVFDFQE